MDGNRHVGDQLDAAASKRFPDLFRVAAVTLNVVVNKVAQNPLDKIDSAGFSARGTFKRSDFGMKTYLGAIGDDVDLIIEIEAKKKS